MGSEVTQTCVQSSPALPQTVSMTLPSLSFLTCESGVAKVPVSEGFCENQKQHIINVRGRK